MKRLLNTAFAWTILGLIAGVGWREYTKAVGVAPNDGNALSTLHTHILTLGMLMFFLVLALDAVFSLTGRKTFTWFYWLYNGGLALTVVMMVIRGVYQVNGVAEAQTTAAIPGIAGLGHIALAGGLISLYFALSGAIKDRAAVRTGARRAEVEGA